MSFLGDFFEGLFGYLIDLFRTVGYPGIVAFMALESSFVPFPSEVVMGPAGVLAYHGEMNAAVAVFMGTFGSVVGALFNYWLAVKLGRPFFIKYGKYVLIREKTFTKAEGFFQRHGEIATFVCRLIPGIRQYVSLPAGLARMHLGRFTLFTALGAGLWCTVLVFLGMGLGEILDQESAFAYMKEHAGEIFLKWVIPGSGLLIGGYWIWNRFVRTPTGPVDEPGTDAETANDSNPANPGNDSDD